VGRLFDLIFFFFSFFSDVYCGKDANLCEGTPGGRGAVSLQWSVFRFRRNLHLQRSVISTEAQRSGDPRAVPDRRSKSLLELREISPIVEMTECTL